jgi:hypothetical protein
MGKSEISIEVGDVFFNGRYGGGNGREIRLIVEQLPNQRYKVQYDGLKYKCFCAEHKDSISAYVEAGEWVKLK